MCRPKEPIAGVFLLLVLAAGGWVAQEPFPHFGIDLPAEALLEGERPVKPVSPRHRTQFDESQFSSAMLELVPMYATVE
ncbi:MULTISPECIES: hypothetical protein [Pseudomonas]|uniref:Uncharacterized protein n=4 Tax=Pseudomonas syringae group TaxID=136849 RepID=A0A3M4KXD5_PSEA0|nr:MULTISPECIES: hypothetical protein [Pseudomonas]KPW35604.1 Uncharacterized protein ALO51_02316 [Pseudomonas amygdali]KPX83449.1 Uncharacterized protein ALO59_03410 [Pseudomonas amygdali pv. mellea]KPY64189.1 Uncharacterized protein ALO93_02581 [Pseudomonas amygdali pv. sesami]KTB75093.1 hypothetical protein AO068_04535 [Pseudomonas sp. ICMP 3272]KTC57132.1 hypothetical protein AO258_04250 [Pseudomonas syringae ICMP 19498]